MRWSEGAPRIEEIDEDHDMGGSDGDGDGRVDDEDEEDRLDKERDASLRWDDNIDDAMRKRVWGDANGATGKGKKEDRPVVVNADEPAEEGEDGMEMDMENEMNDFLSFARETLGVGEDQWNGILQSRQDRGGTLVRPLRMGIKLTGSICACGGQRANPRCTAVRQVCTDPDSSRHDSTSSRR
jgi:hypothetical protein